MVSQQANYRSCEQELRHLSDADEEELLNTIDSWRIDRNSIHLLHKSFVFDSYTAALEFVRGFETIIDVEQSSYSSMHIHYQTVSIELNTQSIGGLSEVDFLIAASIDDLYSLSTQPVADTGCRISENVRDTLMPV